MGPYRSLTLPFEPFRFWLRICRDICNRKGLPDSASRRLSDSGRRVACLYSANTNGAPMLPAPIGIADRTQKNIRETQFKYYWRTEPVQHCLLAEGDICAPIYRHTNAPRATSIGTPIPIRGDRHCGTLGILSKFYIAYWRTEHKKFKKEADRIFRCA